MNILHWKRPEGASNGRIIWGVQGALPGFQFNCWKNYQACCTCYCDFFYLEPTAFTAVISKPENQIGPFFTPIRNRYQRMCPAGTNFRTEKLFLIQKLQAQPSVTNLITLFYIYTELIVLSPFPIMFPLRIILLCCKIAWLQG